MTLRDLIQDLLLHHNLDEELDITLVTLKRQLSEFEDVYAAFQCHHEGVINDLCQIIFEGEDTDIGRKITIDKLKDALNYKEWLNEGNN